MDPANGVEAGGLVPPDAALPDSVVTDTVDARGYRHPGLPDRLVVRLVPDAIAHGVDTEMALLGFGLQVHHDDIARQRRRSLGFPGWALVHDPANARLALGVMKAFRAEAKRAQSKPGHAKEGFQEIATGLARKVPHFLPSFWEEAGRAFVEAANPKMAATAFEKARQAEREYGLEIDEQRRSATFLEFALAGAITVKSLVAWARELAASEGPEQAWVRFSTLAARRTLGGLPPWAGLAKDLRTLARAAGRDPDAEDERFVAEVIGATSLDRAPASFWEDFRPALERVARRDPAFALRLLDRFPTHAGDEDEAFALAWLDLLHGAGALAHATSPAPFPLATGRARWLGRAIAWAPSGFGPLLQLVRAMAPALRAEAEPVPIGDGDWAHLDVDLGDLFVELGVPLPADLDPWFDLDGWGERAAAEARWGLPAEPRPRDPVHLVAHPRLGPLLARGVGDHMGEAGFEAAARGSRAFADARRAWLGDQISRIGSQGVPSAVLAVEALADRTDAGTLAPWPDLRSALAAAEVAQALAHSLAVGLPEELAWPAWEAAKAELGDPFQTTPSEGEVVVGGPLPYTVLASSRRAVVLGPDGERLAAFDLKLGKGEEVAGLAWIDGRLLLAFRDADWEGRGRWVPDRETFEVDVPYWESVVPIGVPAPSGGVSCGGEPVRVGDHRWPAARQVFTDGRQAWVVEGDESQRLDPDTGKAGPIERPDWLRDVEGRWLDDCRLHPAPAGSPLGGRDGLYGFRVLDEGKRFERIDGRWVGDVIEDERPQALVTLPGDDRPRPAFADSWDHDGVRLCSPDGWIASVSGPGVPLDRWHWTRPRDPAASLFLRTISVERARALLDAVRDADDPSAAIAPLVPEVSDPVLRAAVGALARTAAEADGRLRGLLDRPEDAGAGERSGVTTEMAREAMGVLVDQGWGDEPLGDAIRTGLGFLATGEGASRVRWTDLDWGRWYPSLRALGWAAARVGATDRDRHSVAEILRLWADAGGCAALHLRRATWTFDRIDAPFLRTKREDGETCLLEHWTVAGEGWRALAWTDDTWSDEGPFTVETLECSSTGAFPDHAGATHTAEQRWAAPGADAAWVERMVAAIHAHGERLPTDEETALVADRTGIGRGAAVLLLAGAPRFGEWSKDFLGKELRAALGLKVTEAAAGKEALGALGSHEWLDLLARAMPDDPGALWSPLVPAERLAEAWLAKFGTRTSVPDELRTQADKELPDTAALSLLAAPDADGRLRNDGAWAVDEDGTVSRTGDAASFDATAASLVAHLVPWAFGALPVGDPLRANLGRVIRAARERVAHPGLLVEVAQWWPFTSTRKARTLFDAVGGTHETRGDDDTGKVERRDTGALVVVITEDPTVAVVMRPARMDAAAWDTLRMLRDGLGDPDDGDDPSDAVAFLLSDAPLAFAERLVHTPVPVGSWEQDPAASVPDLVAEVARTQRLGADAARLYLQLLAHHAPAKKSVLRWNGWTPRTYEAAAAALVERRLVVAGKRARAGRDHFLPGPWLERRKDLPLERWKIPLYGGHEERNAVRFPLGVILPLEPWHALFARAWRRVSDGDAPRF